jgi:putative two-component system response regulator
MDLTPTEPAINGHVLVVDDNEGAARHLERLLSKYGFHVDVAHDGHEALQLVGAAKPDLVLLDVVLPTLDGFEVCRRLKQEATTRLLPVVLITAHGERDKRILGAQAGADDFLSKPVDSQELLARVTSLIRLKRYTDDLDSASSIIMMLATMVESRDGYSVGHCHRMANYAAALGRRLGLAEHDLQALRRGGFLHDIGMMAIPDVILRKRGRLEPEEYELIKSHTLIGDSLCGHLRSLQGARPIVRHHHERLDGSGYPDGLKGDEIPLLAQIIGLVDAFDAMTTQRSYQGARADGQAMEVLRDQVRRGWRRADLTDCLLTLVEGGSLEVFKSPSSSQPSWHVLQ